MGRFGRVTCTLCIITAQTSQEGITFTKAKRVFKVLLSNLYIVGMDKLNIPMHLFFLVSGVGNLSFIRVKNFNISIFQ